jgi:hypothetical protein
MRKNAYSTLIVLQYLVVDLVADVSFRESKTLLLIKRCMCDVLFLSTTKPVFLYLLIRSLIEILLIIE